MTDRAGRVAVLPPDDGGEAEGRRAIRLVEALASRWGCERGDWTSTTWFDLQA